MPRRKEKFASKEVSAVAARKKSIAVVVAAQGNHFAAVVAAHAIFFYWEVHVLAVVQHPTGAAHNLERNGNACTKFYYLA